MNALSVYDGLIADPQIPHGSFLYYQRQIALNALLESHAPLATLDGPELEDVIMQVAARP